MNAQRLRNITTGRLHTSMSDIYEDLGCICGDDGIMTHMLPRVREAVLPWLREHAPDPRLWDGQYDTSHDGEYNLPEPTADERADMLSRYQAMPDPLARFEVQP